MPPPELTVFQVMQPDPVTVEPDCPVGVVLGLMNLHRIGAVIVAGPDRRLAGIFTERDLLRRVGSANPGWQDLPVSAWMTTDPYTIAPSVGWEDAIGMMERLRVRHLPVIDGGKVVGIVSTRMLLGRRAEFLNRRVEERTRELKQANDQLLARETEIVQNLRAAGRLQTRLLLPQSPPDWPELGWAVHYAPLDHLGGDYYDFARPDPDHIGVLIADASGHSIAASVVAVMTRIAFAEVANTTVRPGEVLTAMNRRLQGLADERFVTAFYGVLDRRTGEFAYANAGHPYPFRRSATGAVQPLGARGFLLGIMPDEIYEERSARLEPGDRLCFYTDGLVEARNEIGETFGTERLRGCLTEHGAEPADHLVPHILGCQRGFSGPHPLADDLTLVVAELRGGAVV
jgi:sigma-B regulation protein RsbU (phosphoserine phosphatase)